MSGGGFPVTLLDLAGSIALLLWGVDGGVNPQKSGEIRFGGVPDVVAVSAPLLLMRCLVDSGCEVG
jgi:hypothetical protein